MSLASNRIESHISASIQRCAGSVKQTGRGRWGFELVNGKPLPITARLSTEWLVFDAPISDRRARQDLWQLLRLNGTLGGLCKFVLMPDRRSLHLRADVPLTDRENVISEFEDLEPTIPATVSQVVADLKAAFRRFKGEQTGPGRIPETAAARGNEPLALHRLCTDAGWPFVERSAGTMMVELDSHGGFYQALLEQRALGIHVSVGLSSPERLSRISRRALSTLLLSAGGQVKLARPAVCGESADQIAAGFEVNFPSIPTATELIHALSALSVASEVCGRETKAIEDETIARHYLAISGAAKELAESTEQAMLSAAD